jgi:PAS domain S-box-containing protein
MRLTTKLLILFTAISALIVLAFGGVMYQRQRYEQLQLIRGGISQQITDFDNSMNNFFDDVEGDVSALALNEVVRSKDDSGFTSFLQADERTFQYQYTDREKAIIQIFNTHRLTHPYVNSVYMGREDGVFVRSHPREIPTRYDPRDRPWYLLAKSNPGSVMLTAPYASLTTPDINIGVVKALVDENGMVYGVVGMDVTLVKLTSFILSFPVHPAGTILLADPNGVILASQDKQWTGQQIEAYSPALPALLSSNTEGFDSLDVHGQPYFLLHQHSAKLNMQIIVLVPVSDVENEIRASVLWPTLSLSAGLLLLSLLTFSSLQFYVIRSLRKLTEETDFIARTGDLTCQIEIQSGDEFGTLAASYNKMVSSLNQSQKSLLETENALRVAHQELVNIIEFLPDATFVIDQDKRVIAWNRACVTLTGVAKEKVLGLGGYAYAEPFFGERRPMLIDVLDMPPKFADESYKDDKQFNHAISAESYIPRMRDGQGAYLWGLAAPLFDQDGHRSGSIEVVRDVTDQRRVEEKLRESEQKYRELVEQANSIILRWTHEGRITFLNEFGQRFFGFTNDEIIGRFVLDTIVPAKDREGRDLRPLMEQIQSDPAAFEKNVNENVRRNGERVWIAWTNRIARDEEGRVTEIFSVGTDITELKRAEEAIRELNIHLEKRVDERTAELAVAKDKAEESDQLKSAFLATMSHELRTPLNSIIGFTGILLQGLAGPLTVEQRKQLEMVRDSSRHLLALINDVLDISKIEAGQLVVKCEPFDLPASVEKVAGIVKPLAEKKGLKLRVELAPDIGPFMSDPRRVEQILINLLNNAIKFTEQGEITLEAEVLSDIPRMPPSMDASLGANSPQRRILRVSVTDTGIGIREEDLGKLFRPFHQIDTWLSRQHEGTGLGLAICRRLAELLGGEINAVSEWGKGSVFTFTLPLNGQGAI